MKERYFRMALGVIFISFIVNTLYAQSKQLKEPIFLDHFIETSLDDHNNITFYYLANKNDRSRISYMELGGELHGYPQNDFLYMEASPPNIDTYTHHVLRSVTVQLDDFGVEHSDPLTFNEITAHFMDEVKTTVITASIGEVIIHPERYPIRDHSNALVQHSGGSSNDGSSWGTFQATEPLAIEKISFPFNQPIEDRFNFTINGKQTEQSLDSLELPIHLEKDKYLTMRISIQKNNFTNPFDFAIRITGTTEQGHPFTNYAYYNLFPYLTQEDVKRIIEEKSGRDSGE